jgi:hypothetical protein
LFSLKFISKENELNKIIKNQKRDRDDFLLLHIALWDDSCTRLMRKLIDTYAHVKEGRPIYVIDSFTLPHSFVIYKVTQAPALVYVSDREVKKMDYIPTIYEYLNLK